MKALAIPMLGAVLVASPAFAADLGGYDERSYADEGPSRVVERGRIVERRYYEPAPVVRQRVVREEIVVPRREVLVEDDYPVDSYWGPRRYYSGFYGPRWYGHRRWGHGHGGRW